jgi:UDP-glucose 4-epimerase
LEKIILTGGTGFIGSHLAKRLMTYKPKSITIISNTANANSKNTFCKESNKAIPLTFYTTDIRNKENISNIFREQRADTCIHLAAKISVADSIKNPQETMDINVNGTLNVLEACHNSGVHNLIFASSAAVYGDATELPISENQVLKPLSPYGSSKMLAEQHVSSYVRLSKIQNAISLRIFNVYGPGQTGESDVITKFAKRLSNGMPPIIYGNGMHTRDFISVDDVVEAILLSIRTMEQSGNNAKAKFNSSEVFNVGTGKPTSIGELAQKIIDTSGLDLHPIYEEGSADNGIILHSYADMTKAKAILHFVPKKTIDTGLREMIEPTLLRK